MQAQRLWDLQKEAPINLIDYIMPGKSGLVHTDPVNGFCKVGAGNLAPPAPDSTIEFMLAHIGHASRAFVSRKKPVLVLMDQHPPGVLEPPYLPHCEKGTGEELIHESLAWLEQYEYLTRIPKDCINGFVGAILPNGMNLFEEWINRHLIETLVVDGICTDICVMDFVLTVLSARNHGILPSLKDVVVYVPGCATYDWPREIAEMLGKADTFFHPRELTHHMGLYFMASRGAILANSLNWED